MPRPILAFPTFLDDGVSYEPTLSNGSYTTTLPLTNIKTRHLSEVARTSNALAASTKFDADLGVARAVGLLAILVPNLTQSSVPTVRWRGASDSGFISVVYDSGTVQAFPSGVDRELADGLNIWTVTIPSTAQTARYWRCEIVDTANVDGYLDFARVFIAQAYYPTIAPVYGAKFGAESDSVRSLTDGGAALYDKRPIRRTVQFTIANIAEAEAMGDAFRLQRQAQTTGQIFFVWDADETTYGYVRRFPCVMRELSAIEHTFNTSHASAYGLVEDV